MKLNALVLLATTFLSVTASASWYVSSVSCTQTPDPARQNQVIHTSFRNGTYDISHGFYERNANGSISTPIPTSEAFTGTFTTRTKINPRDVWVGIFYIVEIYDGLDLNDGQVTFSNGIVAAVKAEIRFLPFTDKAYGPDYASVIVWTKPVGSPDWQVLASMDQCYVSVYH